MVFDTSCILSLGKDLHEIPNPNFWRKSENKYHQFVTYLICLESAKRPRGMPKLFLLLSEKSLF